MDVARSSSAEPPLLRPRASYSSDSGARSANSSPASSRQRRTLVEVSARLARFMIRKYTEGVEANGRYEECLARVSEEIADRHKLMLQQCTRQLRVCENNGPASLLPVLDAVLADGKKGWGRLVCVYTYAGFLAREVLQQCEQLPEAEAHAQMEQMSRDLNHYVIEKLGHWIQLQGGWDAMLEHFSSGAAKDDQSSWMPAIVTTGLFIGLGALYKVFKG